MANPTPPHAHVLPGRIEFDKTMGRGSDDEFLTVQVIVGAPSDRGAQILLDQFLAGSGAKSIKEKVEADPDLGGACDDLRVTEVSGYRTFTIEGAQALMLGAEFTVHVIAAGE